jgi:hypothetical protein
VYVPVGLRVVDAAQIRFFRTDLRLIEAFAVGLPEIELGAGHRFAVQIANGAADEAGNAGRSRGHVGAVAQFRRAGDMKKAFDRRRRRRLALQAMVDRINEHADAKHIGRENEFLALIAAHLAGAREPIDRRRPFRLGRLDLADEGVKMRDQRRHDLAQTRIGNIGPALLDDIGQILLGDVGRGFLRNCL